MNGYTVTDGKLAIGDPCYNEPDVILDVKPGNWVWNTSAEQKHYRPKHLWAYHGSRPYEVPDITEYLTFLSVDSGTIGIRDLGESWDSCRITNGMFPNYSDYSSYNLSFQYSEHAMVCSTYYGDGCYKLYVKRNSEDEIVALYVDLVDDIDYEEDQDDEDW